ncbi:hypothetical protein AcdelDRAFT_2522 [Acidovorax delafieldii 2AN]|uniref:Uncharacterized protein n=1 Tax=Acidovorax delafieldii 2AN TaxID=573060 RepID=C5T6J2_ACIDE|nr:hypothetical protein [Acidovorax delafieldii]EER59905.1 hypothetical protein AcdelDRAFT_2522 [Acidovorax delafieldii 2AN]
MANFKKILAYIGMGLVTFSVTAEELTAPSAKPIERVLEKNNTWRVTISNRNNQPANLIYAVISRRNDHWVVDRFFKKPPLIPKTEQVELFAVTPDLQQWFNAFTDLISNCHFIEVRSSRYHSVCSSSLAEPQVGIGVARIFFGAGGKIPFGYTDKKVEAAINSINASQAEQKLLEFEKSLLDAQ